MRTTVILPLSLVLLLLAGVLGISGAETRTSGLDEQIAALDLERDGVKLGIHVVVEGHGVVYSRSPRVPRSTASAIKTAIALDLLIQRGASLDEAPVGIGNLLQPGTHYAFHGFSGEQLARARAELTGRSFWELTRIMMGQLEAGNEVYNAACNLIMIKLGGPRAIQDRIHQLDPSLSGLDINRYMESWTGDGDNTATPEALVSLYRMTAGGVIPGLTEDNLVRFRSLLRHHGNGGPGTVYEKMGTLFPRPMVRVHAGYLLRESGNLVYAVMGEIPEAGDREDPAELFLRLMNGVDRVTESCRRLAP